MGFWIYDRNGIPWLHREALTRACSTPHCCLASCIDGSSYRKSTLGRLSQRWHSECCRLTAMLQAHGLICCLCSNDSVQLTLPFIHRSSTSGGGQEWDIKKDNVSFMKAYCSCIWNGLQERCVETREDPWSHSFEKKKIDIDRVGPLIM